MSGREGENAANHRVNHHKELRVYQAAFEAALEIFQLTKSFPAEEKYSLIDQVRRSSRSVCANITEAWRKRRYEAAFISKLNDAETEAAETQTWLEFAERFGYLDAATHQKLDAVYHRIIAQLITMETRPKDWLLK